MKKFLRIVFIVVVLIVAALVLLPIIFKGKIQDAVKDAANENLTAVLDFDDVSLSLFRDFPRLSVSIKEMSLTGQSPFEGVQLINAKEIRATIDLASLFGDEISVREIALVAPNIDVRVLSTGEANYDIVKESDEVTPEDTSDTESGGFKLNLAKYSVTDGSIRYDDATYPMLLDLQGLQHSGSGDFTESVFLLNTETEIAQGNVVYDGVHYVLNATAKLNAELEIDNNTSTYTFKDNELLLNMLPLKADGWVAMPGDDIDMDIKFSSTGSDLKHLISMIPAEFAADLEGVSASGRMEFNGFVRGIYNDTSMPGFGLNLGVENGSFNYPDLPKSVENIDIDLEIDASAGMESDAMTVDLNRFYMEIADNPIDLTFHLKNPYTDPLMNADLVAKIDFASLSDVVPMEDGDALKGMLNADMHFNGRLSAIEEERYNDFEARGEMVLLGLNYKSDSLDYDVDLRSAYLKFTPRFAELTNFEANIGESDLSATGRLDNYLEYALRDSLLTGVFTMRSELLDLNALMADSADETSDENPAGEAEEEATEMAVIQIPGNVNFTLNTRFDKLLYDDLVITNTRGSVILKDKVATLRGLAMELLGSNITMDGNYDTREALPSIDMDFAIRNMDIKQAAETFYTIEKMAPIAKSCSGKFSTTLKMKAQLNEKMEPVEESITGGGTLETKEVVVEKFEPLNKIAGELGIDRLSKQTIKDVKLTYAFENGRIGVDPFTINLEGIETVVDGSMSFSQELDYNVKMTVPADKLPGNLAGKGSDLLNSLNKQFGSNLSMGSKIPVMLKVTGTVEDPKVKGNYGDSIKEQGQNLKEEVKEQVKEAVEEKIDEAREEAIAKARKEAAEMIAQANTQADAIIASTRKNADQAKAAAYSEAQKVEDSAKNPLEKAAKKLAADKIRDEADKAHEKTMSEARKNADKIIADAEQRAEAKIASAEKE